MGWSIEIDIENKMIRIRKKNKRQAHGTENERKDTEKKWENMALDFLSRPNPQPVLLGVIVGAANCKYICSTSTI